MYGLICQDISTGGGEHMMYYVFPQGVEHCMALCTAGVNKDCLAWTFFPATKECWLKNTVPEKQVLQSHRYISSDV